MLARRCLTLLAAVGALCVVSPARAARSWKEFRSPDGKLIARVIDVNRVHESRVEIHGSKGELLLRQDYSSSDMEHGQAIIKAAWTPDGEFFVFSMENTGGHSPLARPTFFYSRKQNRIFDLDQTVGYITESDFELQAPNWVVTKALGKPDGDESEPARVALSTLVK
jgi:hypothetical protein